MRAAPLILLAPLFWVLSAPATAQIPGVVDLDPTPPPNATWPRFVDVAPTITPGGPTFADVGVGRGQALADVVGPDPTDPTDPSGVGPPDGIPDVIQANSNSPALPLGSPQGQWDYPPIGSAPSPSLIFRGQAGGGFAEVAGSMSNPHPGTWSLQYPGGSPWGVLAGDYDADGDNDLFYACGGFNVDSPNALMRNEGDGSFSYVSDSAGMPEIQVSFAGSWVDYDLDGDLDIFVTNGGPTATEFYLGTPVPDPTDRLYSNDGDGTFTEIGAQAGVNLKSSGFTCTSTDLDADGWPDLVVSCFRQYNKAFYNNADGTFAFMSPAHSAGPSLTLDDLAPDPLIAGTEDFPFVPPGALATLPLLGLRSMPVDAADFNNDGWIDLYFASWSQQTPDANSTSALGALFFPGERSHLFLNRGDEDGNGLGDGRFREAAVELGADHVGGNMGALSGDFNGDGYLDFYLGGGGPDLAGHLEEDYLYINDGASWPEDFQANPDQALQRVFYEIGALAGTYSNLSMAHGLTVFARPSGRMDLVIGNGGPSLFNGGQANVYLENRGNVDGSAPRALSVELIPQSSAPGAVGSSVELFRGDLDWVGRPQLRERRGGQAFSSFDDTPLSFGVGNGSTLFVSATWPGGVRQGRLLWPQATQAAAIALTETSLSARAAVVPTGGGFRFEATLTEHAPAGAVVDLELQRLVPLVAPSAKKSFTPERPAALPTGTAAATPTAGAGSTAVSLPAGPGLQKTTAWVVDASYGMGSNEALVADVARTFTHSIDPTVAPALYVLSLRDASTGTVLNQAAAWYVGGFAPPIAHTAQQAPLAWSSGDRASRERPSAPRSLLGVARHLELGAEAVWIAPLHAPLAPQALDVAQSGRLTLGEATTLEWKRGRLRLTRRGGSAPTLSFQEGRVTLAVGAASGCCDSSCSATDARWLAFDGVGELVVDGIRYDAHGRRLSP